MFPFAVEAGIDAREYWEYTLLELNVTVAAHRKRLETKAMMDYKLADLIGASVSRLLDKNAKFPTPAEAYPGLIAAGRSQEEIQAEKTKQWLLKYANAHNAKRRGEQ